MSEGGFFINETVTVLINRLLDNSYVLNVIDDEDDDDYSESLDAIIRRRESGRRRSVRRSPKRVSSPFGSDSESGGKGRRRSSTMTSTSCE